MLKILPWFVSNDARFFQGAMSILERQHNGLDIVGVTASVPVQLQANGKNVTFVPLDKLTGGGGGKKYDVLLVVGAKQVGMSEVVKVARRIHLPDEKLLGDWIACVPGFALKKYRQLQRAQLSIFAMNCFGGLISHTLGLPFRSPTVNMLFHDEYFVKFLRTPKFYLEETPYFERLDFSWDGAPNGYPVLALGDIRLNMVHYKDADAAVDKWLERKARINWYNLFVVMFTESEKILREFDALPFGKKVCFVPFESDLDSAWYINPAIDTAVNTFEEKINRFGFGFFIYFDMFDMLLYGLKTPLET